MTERFSPGWIKTLRSRAGMTQTQLAAVLNVTVSTLSRWEQGNRQPNQHHRMLLLAVKHRLEQPDRDPTPAAASADLDRYVADAYRQADPVGKAAMQAVEHAERANLSPLALHLAGSAAIESAYGTTSTEWIVQRLDGGLDKERLETVIGELIGAGLWPW